MNRPKPLSSSDDETNAKVQSDATPAPEPEEASQSPAAEKPQAPWMNLLHLPAEAEDEVIQDIIDRSVSEAIEKSKLSENYNWLLLNDSNTLSRTAADRIYRSFAGMQKDKHTLLILSSPGGDVAAAYFIAKLCREQTNKLFEVVVPRRAKSAATLICCGADRIHMGSLSELGPIDPQFGAIPALALKHSVEHIAELVGIYPTASGMFSDYLAKSLRVEALGFFERVAESAAQYAVRLLNSRVTVSTNRDNGEIAKRLVYAYKDHGFVIDSREAIEIFGDEIVVCNTEEYQFANALFETLDLVSWICERRFSRDFSYVGGAKQGCWMYKKES